MSTKFAYYSSLRDKGLMDEQSYFNLSMSEYQKNPSTFTEEQVGQMESFAKAQGVEFKRDLEDDENKIVGAINQLTSGVVEGFTTFGWADDPKTQTEAMMNKIGHLIGFAPDIIAGVLTFGASLGASATKKGAFRAARLAAAKKVEDALVYGGKKIPILATERNGKMQLRSVPMKAADWVIEQGKNKLGSSEVLRNSFIGKKVSGLDPQFLNIMEQSAHLSMAMAVSSRKEGPEGWAQAAIHGAAAGAVFGGISNYVNIGKAIASKNPAKINFGHAKIREAADKIFKDLNVAKLEGGISKDTATMIDMGVRGSMGAAFTGGQSTLQGASTPDQVYEYLLGFFFGAAGRPVHEIKATQFIGKNMDKINKFKKDKDGNFVWEPNEIKKIEGFDKESKKTQEYLETFQADYILETMTNRPDDLVDTFYSSLSSVLQGKGKKGQKVLTKREAIKQALDNNAKIKGKVKITAEQVSQMDLDRVKSRPDVDIENVKKGDTIEAFDSATGVPVLAKVSSVTKNGEIRLKRVGETKSTVLDQGTLVSKNIFNPNYKVPANKGISEKYHGKLINELSTKELEALEKEISSMITPELVNMGDSFEAYKRIKAKIEEKGGDVGPQDIFNILNLSHAHKVAALSKLRSKKDLTASEQAALDAITNKGKEHGVEKDIKNNRESDKEAGSENIDPFESLMEGIKKDFPDLNARLSDKYQVYKSAAKNARNFEEYLKAVQAINKEIGFNPEKAYSKSKLKAYRTKLIKDWNANSQKIIKQGLTIEVVKEGWKTKDIKIKITRSVDDVGKPLKSETTIDYYNKFYNKKDGLFEISIEYAEVTGTARLQGEIKMDSFLPKQEAWQAIGPYADIGKAIYDSGAIIMQKGGVDIVQHHPYLHHTNPKTQQAKIRSLAQKDKAAEGGEVPKPIRKDLKDWLKADKDFRKYLINYKTRFGTEETQYKSNNERFYDELLSNVIYELRDAGLISLSNADINLKTVKRAFDKYVKDGMNSYSSIAKYMQYRKVFDNPQARALEIKYGKNGKLNTLIVNDSSELFQNAFNSGEINPDGVKFYRWKLHDAILKNQGRDGDRSNDYIKDILIQAPDFANRRGLLLNKSAAQRPDKELNAFMEAKNIDVIIMESGRKSNSRHPMVQLDYKNGIYSSKNSLRNSIFEIDQESIRLIDSEYDVMDSSLGFEFMPVQSILKRNMNMGKPLNDAITKMIEESRRGDKSYMEDYNKALVDYQVSLLADPNARLKVNNKSLDINRVDLQTILDVMNNQINSPLAKEFMEAMFRDHKNIRNEISESTGDVLDISVKGVNELLAGFNYDPIVLTLGNNMSLFEASFRKHIINRLTRPRSNAAFSFTRMKALTPSVAKMLGKDLKDNNFYLYEGHRDKKITFRNDFKGKDLKGKDTVIYDVMVDMYEHPTLKSTNVRTGKKDALDIWVVDNLEQANKQLQNILQNSKKRGEKSNFSDKIKKQSDGSFIIEHKLGDNKVIYIKGTEPKGLIKDTKGRVKGESYIIKQKDSTPKTLGEAFDLYQTLSKQSPTKNKTEIMNQIKEEILDMIVIRNPVSAPSGINSLTLGGFIEGSQGRGIIVSRKTAEKLGGADYDGDAVAIYNNVPKDFKKGFADPKVANGLDNLIKGGGLTDAGHNVGWGFEQRIKGREAGIKDVFNPQERLEQAVSNAMVSKNIGKVTNFNQDIHDYMNYITQSGNSVAVESFKPAKKISNLKEHVSKEKDTLWIFGDNNARKGTGGSAEIRGLSNAIGVRTKWAPDTKKESYFIDADKPRIEKLVQEDINTIIETFNKGGYKKIKIVGELGAGLAEAPKKHKMEGQQNILPWINKQVIETKIMSGEGKGWRLDLDGNMFLKTKKVHERVNSKGEKIKNNRSGKKEWTAQDHLDYFNDYAAPLLLNLTLDGMKNSKNPDLVHLKQQVFNEHFEITNAKGEVLMLATPENKARKDGHLAILPYLRSNKKQLDLDALTSQRINTKIEGKDGNEKIFDLDWAHKQKNPENAQSNWLSERFFPSKGTDVRLSNILRSEMYHGKVFSIKSSVNALTPVEWIEAKLKNRTVEPFTEAMAKRLLDGKSVKVWSVDVLDKSKKVQRDYTLTDKDKESIKKQKESTPIREIEFKGLNDKGELTGRLLDGLGEDVSIPRKDIIHLDIEHTFFNALEARKDFKNAVNPKAKGHNINEISEKGDVFLTQMTKDSGVADVYLNDSLTDIANGLRIGMFREASMHINPEIFPSSNLPTLFSNLLKGLKNSKNSPVLSKLRENGVLSPEVESWIKITELIEQSGMSTDKAVEVFNMIDSIAPNLMNGAQKSQAIAYQAASAASAIRLELMASRLLDQGKKGNLIDEGFSKKQIEDKLTEIINTSWMIKASDLAKFKSGKELPQNDFNIHEAIKRYKEDYLPYIGEKRLKNKKHIDAFEEIFSHMMLSNISAGKQKIESFYKNMNQELNFGFGKESESPLGKLDLTSRKVKVFNRNTQKNEYKTLPEVMEMYAKQPNHIENRLNDLKSIMNSGRFNSNSATAVDIFKRLISSTRMTMLERPNLLKSDSIPLIHKQNFIKGLRDMIDYGMVKNLKSPEGREAIVVEVDRTPVEFESAVKKALKGADSSLFIPKNVTISKEQIVNNVSYDKNGKPIIKKVSKPDPKKEVFITDAEGIDFVAAVIKNQKSNISLNQNIKDSIVSYVNQLSPEQRVKWLDRKGSTPLNIVDLTRDIDLSNSVINEVQLEQLKRFIDIVDKNPRIAETVEGLFAQFGVDIGITGRPYIGKTIQLMNGNDLRMFNNMLEDLYLKPTNMYQKFKKWTTERKIKVKKGEKIERPKNWLDKAYFYFFTEHVGKKYLEPREMLEHQVQEQIIEDVIEGKVVIGKRTYVAPTNSIELVRRQVDESRKFSAAFQDFFQKDLKERFRELDVEGPLKDYMDEMMEIAVDYRVYDNGEFGGRKTFYKKESRDMFEESFNRSKKRLEEIAKEHSTFEIKDIAAGAGKRKNITPEDLVKLLNNKITDTYQMFVDQLITKGMELDSNGKEYKFTKKTLDDVMHTYIDKDGNRYQFIDYKKINKRYKTQQHGITDIVEALMAPKGSKKSGNLIGMNELLMYRYEYELLNYVKEKFPEFDPAREATHTKEILNFVKSFRKALPMESSLMSLITKNGKADPYWHFQGHLDFSKNKTNIDAWIERSIKS